jgi:hypothetical protein
MSAVGLLFALRMRLPCGAVAHGRSGRPPGAVLLCQVSAASACQRAHCAPLCPAVPAPHGACLSDISTLLRWLRARAVRRHHERPVRVRSCL